VVPVSSVNARLAPDDTTRFSLNVTVMSTVSPALYAPLIADTLVTVGGVLSAASGLKAKPRNTLSLPTLFTRIVGVPEVMFASKGALSVNLTRSLLAAVLLVMNRSTPPDELILAARPV
jgi:hypothetical protein